MLKKVSIIIISLWLITSCAIGDMPRENEKDPDAGNYSGTPAGTSSSDCVLGVGRLGECGL